MSPFVVSATLRAWAIAGALTVLCGAAVVLGNATGADHGTGLAPIAYTVSGGAAVGVGWALHDAHQDKRLVAGGMAVAAALCTLLVAFGLGPYLSAALGACPRAHVECAAAPDGSAVTCRAVAK